MLDEVLLVDEENGFHKIKNIDPHVLTTTHRQGRLFCPKLFFVII